jgi:uncharacterized protein (TIGR00255 family)
MTGFGEAEVETQVGVLRAEIRTVNHRFFSLNVRNPSALDRFEPAIRDWLKDHLSRGHINLTYRLEGAEGETGPALALDLDRARHYLRIFRELGRELAVPGDVTLEMLARQSDLVVRDQVEVPEVPEEVVLAATDEAARAVVAMREREGQSLRTDLEERLDAIGTALEAIAREAPLRLVRERDRLRRSVAELAGDVAVDEDRLAREIALLADR